MSSMALMRVLRLYSRCPTPRPIHRINSEDTTWSSAGVFGTIGSTGEKALDVTGLKEILRYKFKFLTTTTATDAVHFFMQAPSWRPF